MEGWHALPCLRQAQGSRSGAEALMLLSGSARARRPAALIIAIGLCFSTASPGSEPVAEAGSRPSGAAVPPWLFPFNSASGGAAEYDRVKPLHVPNSDVTFTESQLNDFFTA